MNLHQINKSIIYHITLVIFLTSRSLLYCRLDSDSNNQQQINNSSYDSKDEKYFSLIQSNGENGKPSRPECIILKDIGVNDLSVNDVVVRSATSSLVCIKARFSLAIKVEALLEHYNNKDLIVGRDNNDKNGKNDLILLGYLPLDSVVSVNDNCYDPPVEKNKKSSSTTTVSNSNQKNEDNAKQSNAPALDKEPELTIEFVCGKLTFRFHKDDEHYFVSSIKGVVNLDPNTERAFEFSSKPIFETRDLNHHFKHDPLIEIVSETTTKAYILTANFYKTELEAFRNTSGREFIRPPEKEEPGDEVATK